ncbi:MAG: hypothetical protein AAFN04_17010, partial [Pseudomonadota bacterium]
KSHKRIFTTQKQHKNHTNEFLRHKNNTKITQTNFCDIKTTRKSHKKLAQNGSKFEEIKKILISK